jgi:hypothetical protein
MTAIFNFLFTDIDGSSVPIDVAACIPDLL